MKSIYPPQADRNFFAPEVVQTSAMDCGPAALKSILEGFRVPVSYGRLREACQTDVDGTSINTVEDIAIQLGLRAEQVMLPVDHLALPEAQALPAIVVVQRPSGLTHFLVVWNRVGNFLQVMDPATGRRWPTWNHFQNEIFIHTFPVPVAAWREWAGSEGLLAPLRRRLSDLNIDDARAAGWIEEAMADSGWRMLATLDAAARMTAALVGAKGIAPGEQAARVLEQFYRLNPEQPLPRSGDERSPAATYSQQKSLVIPEIYWSALPLVETEAQKTGREPVERLLLRGAVLVRILGRQPAVRFDAAPDVTFDGDQSVDRAQPFDDAQEVRQPPRAHLPPDLRAALDEPRLRPEQAIWEALRQDGLLTPFILIPALLLATMGVLVEALLFQGLIRIGQSFSLVSQKILAAIALLAFILGLLALELPISATVLRMGRRLEARLRIALLEKIPRLGDRYFRSRLTSDMTQRAYDLRALRSLPGLGVSLLRTGFQLILTTIGVIWLDPRSAPLAILGTAFFVALSVLTRPLVEERDLRMRTHTGALSRFYLDSLLGLLPARTHGAERALRRQHESQLYEWVRTGREAYSVAAALQAVGALLYSGFAILILVNYLLRGGEANEVLLLFYWTLSLPALGQSVADAIQQYPMQRNMVLRLLEPLSAPDEEAAWVASGEGAATTAAEQRLTDRSLEGRRGQDEPDGSAPDRPVSSHPADPASSVDPPIEGPTAEAPLIAPTEPGQNGRSSPPGIAISGVTLQAGGHVILRDIDLQIAPGEHIAIVGPSGAGKSSLVGLLLGWHRPSAGEIRLDGQVLDGSGIAALRRSTAWVDPAVQLWNQSLYDNLRYGKQNGSQRPIAEAIEAADLYEVLTRLPEGLKTDLGESGGLVSGGEGQRVRLGRAMLRSGVRLVILDEPFRGLDREKRRELLQRSRQLWQQATLLCITHDIGETQTFGRVLVIEDGRIVEDAAPETLAADPGSRYSSILAAEQQVRRELWENVAWRRLTIDKGILTEHSEEPQSGDR